MYTPASFIESIPGFSASVVTPRELHITSAFWVGKMIYYPEAGKIDTKYMTVASGASDELDFLKRLSDEGSVTPFTIATALGYSPELLGEILKETLKNSI